MQALSGQPSFLVYNASAGSGKTYSLVKMYLIQLLGRSQVDGYRHMLAITFTNKAVAEMKERIVGYLSDIARYTPGGHKHQMMRTLEAELGLSETELSERARKVLHHLLHHYAGFSVETIDGFNQRLIRTFARDLKISSNFEVSLELDELLSRAVARLIEQAGEDPEITRILVDFSMQKADDDRSWDISTDILEVSKILFSENDRLQVARLSGKTLAQFRDLQDKLIGRLDGLKEELAAVVREVSATLESHQIPDKAFNRASYPKYFKKLALGNTDVSFGAQWQDRIREQALYTETFKKAEPETAALMDGLQEQLAAAFEETRRLIPQIWMLENLLSNITPLSVINLVRGQIDAICAEENILPIAEFNERIHREISGEPVPYIYERLGERYRHFYIDEFQDTSLLQWQNLIPLIDNALSQVFEDGKAGSLLLVGDAKQSIYRWRGGVPEQFIELYSCHNPFTSAQKTTKNLGTNYRSYEEIVRFNNQFFTYLADWFGDEGHAGLYREGNDQKTNDKKGGFVELSFIESGNKEEDQQIYGSRVVQLVRSLLEEGYPMRDICILTRKTRQGVALGKELMDSDIPVVSSETLLLSQAPLVQFLENLIRYSTDTGQESTEVAMLVFLHEALGSPLDLHCFLSDCKESEKVSFAKGLDILGCDLDPGTLEGRPLYELCEYAVDALHLNAFADACLEGFLDMVFEFDQSGQHGSFLDHWESQKEKAAVNVPDGMEAVRIMTIHKAKGLEFPVVIFPYADERIYYENRPKDWFDLSLAESDFGNSLISVKKEMEFYNAEACEMYQQRRSILELDTINLLYVTFTRAIERLYVIGRRPREREIASPTTFNALLASYLAKLGKWNEQMDRYHFGAPPQPSTSRDRTDKHHLALSYRANFPDRLSLKVAGSEAAQWFDQKEEQISKGSELHALMAKIRLPSEADPELKRYLEKDRDPWREEVVQMARNILECPELQRYFEDAGEILNERALLSAHGEVLRPDRIHFNTDGSVTVLDYKTGQPKAAYRDQLERYCAALQDMGYRVREGLLIYASAAGVLINKL